MALFPGLEFETRVQIKDRTRLDAAKTYTTKGADPITTLTIRPGDDQTPIDVFNVTPSERFTDFEWTDWTVDIWEGFNDKIDFDEGSGPLVATVTAGTYTFSELLDQIKDALEAVGSNTYTLTSDADNKITFSADGRFKLIPKGANKHQSLLPHIGVVDEGDFASRFAKFATEVTGEVTEYLHKRIQVVAGDGTETSTTDFPVKLYSIEGDRLFSDDSLLSLHEFDILKWVRPGRNTYKDFHRRAQDLIMEWIYKQGFTNIYRNALTKFDIIELRQVKDWATYLALNLIFEDLSNSTDDVFYRKSLTYKSKAVDAKARFLRIDFDKDGFAEDDENIRTTTGSIFIR